MTTTKDKPCRPCKGRGYLEGTPGFQVTAGLVCPFCRGVGRE